MMKRTKKRVYFIGQGVNQSQFYPQNPTKPLGKSVYFCCRASNVNNQKGPNTAKRLLVDLADKYNIHTWDDTVDSRFKEFPFTLCTSVVNKNSYAKSIYHKADIIVTLDEISAWNCIAGEAMSCGIPVISNGEGLEDYGIPDYNYCLLDDTEDIDHCVDYILKNEKYRNNLIRNGIETMKNFTWDKVAIRLEDSINTFNRQEKI